MNGALDAFLVGLALCAGFGYAIYSLGPKSLRARLLTGIAALLARLPAAGLRGASERMAAAAGRAKGSCGGCDNCGPSEAAGPSGARPGGTGEDAGASEIRIPLARIGKRR